MPGGQHEIGIIVDPQRDGLKDREAFKPLFMRAKRVVYFSCNLATWEQGATFLQDCGLDLDDVSGLDIFPKRPHIETLSVFTWRVE